MKSMNLNEAINIVAEEAVRCRRMSNDMIEPPLGTECMKHAAELRRRADAMDKLVNVARVFRTASDE